MRYIAKGDEPDSFLKWRNKNPSVEWNDFSKPESQHREIYSELRKTLIAQQHKMCCYCEIALKEDYNAHVEHYKDKGRYQTEMYSFGNLLASCQHSDSCGHKKLKGYFVGMISPLDKHCQKKFTYTGTGKIIPNDENDLLAQQTIDVLGLNCKRLKDQRKNIIKTLEDSNSDLEYVKQALANCLEWHNGFYTVIEYVITNISK